MSSAASRVLSTPELLELILLHLPLPSLLLSQRISAQFNSLIKSSPALQHALFFRPSRSPSPSTSKEKEKEKKWHVNPLLRQHFLPFFAAPEGRFSSRDYFVLYELDWATYPSTRSAFLRKEASWRRMRLVPYSAPSLRVRRWVHGQGGSSEDVSYMPFPDGVTMGVVYDLVQSFLLRNPVASFAVAFEAKGREDGVAISLYLDMTMQCCVDDDEDDRVVLRSEGEEVGIRDLEWKTDRENDVVDYWHDSGTDLTVEQGGVGEEEWEEWKKARVNK